MSTLRRYTLGAALLSFAPACKSGPDPDEPVRYVLRSKDLGLLGATVTIAGTTVTFARERYNANEDVARADASVPRSTPPLLGSLAVELSTPCGPKAIALTADVDAATETSMREHGLSIQPMLTPSEPVPASRAFWTDAKDGAVTVGKATLARGGNRLVDLECAGSPATIAIEGRALGPVPAFDEPKMLAGKSAVFIAAAPETCYRYSQVVYAKAGSGGGGFEKRLAGSQIHVLASDEIQYFLREASGTSNVEHATYELIVVPCGP